MEESDKPGEDNNIKQGGNTAMTDKKHKTGSTTDSRDKDITIRIRPVQRSRTEAHIRIRPGQRSRPEALIRIRPVQRSRTEIHIRIRQQRLRRDLYSMP